MATAVGDLVVNLSLNNKRFTPKLDQARKDAKALSKDMITKLSKSLSFAELTAQQFSKKMIDGMSKSAAATRALSKEVSSIPPVIDSSAKSMSGHNRISGKASRAMLELSRGMEDASVVWGTQGLSGAIRASTNNLTQFASILSPLAGVAAGVVATFVAMNVTRIEEFFGGGAKKAKEFAEATKKAAEALRDLNRARAEGAGKLAVLDFLGKGKGPEKRFALEKGNVDAERQELAKITGEANKTIQQQTEARKKAAKLALKSSLLKEFPGFFAGGFERERFEKVQGGTPEATLNNLKNDPLFRSVQVGPESQAEGLSRTRKSVAKASKPFDDEIKKQEKLINTQVVAVKDAQKRLDAIGPVAAQKPGTNLNAAKDAGTTLNKLALSFKSPFDQARENLKQTEQQIESLGKQAGKSRKEIDALIGAARQKFQNDFAKFLSPAGAAKPGQFTKDQIKAADQIKASIRTPWQILQDELKRGESLRDKGLLSKKEFGLFEDKKRDQYLSASKTPAASGPRFSGALEAESAGAFSAIISASGNTEQKNEQHNKKTKENTKKIADGIAALNQKIMPGQNIVIVESLLS